MLALASVPRALFMVIGGALVDRFSPRAVMLVSNLVRMLLVALLALLVIGGAIQLWMLYLLALAFGTADAFYFPAQGSIVPQLLQDDQLQMGNTLTQGMAMLSMFLGPVLAGIMIAVLGSSTSDAAAAPGTEGIGLAFLLDALSFLASLAALWLIRTRKTAPASTEQSSVWGAIKEGVAYIWQSPVLKTVFGLLIAINLLVTGPFEVGIPVLADRNLAGGAAAFGILMSAYGGGALLGIILAGVLPRLKPALFGPIILSVTGLLGIGMLLLPLSSSTPLVALISLVMGTTMGFVNIHFMTWLQKRIPDTLMGRVMSLLMFASVGIAPVSSMLAGIILNSQMILLFVGAGALMTIVAVIAAMLPVARQMGLEVAEVEKKMSIAEALERSSEFPAFASTGRMPSIRL